MLFCPANMVVILTWDNTHTNSTHLHVDLELTCKLCCRQFHDDKVVFDGVLVHTSEH